MFRNATRFSSLVKLNNPTSQTILKCPGVTAFNQRRNVSEESKSFGLNLFRGQVKTEQVFPFPDVLSTEQKDTLKMFVDQTEKFFETENDALKNDALEKVDEPTMEGLKALGAFGLQVPEELNGVGLNNTQYARLVEIVGANDLGVGITLGAHQSIGFKGILLYGNKEQKEKYLPKLATGELMAAFCLTEPASGSDASSIRTKATLSDDGKHYILNGGKLWISNGGLAEIFTVFAQTPMKDEKTGEMKDKVTAFIVERSFGGVTNGPPEKKMGIKASNTAEVHFEDVKVPVENILGGLGGGFKVAMNILNNGRFGMAAALSGTQTYCIRKAVEHAASRVQFQNSIGSYGTIQEKIANMCIKQYVTESMAYMISANMDAGFKDFQIEAAISKIYASEAAWFCADEAIQILAGTGYMRDCGVERVMRDLRIFRIFEGTNDILRLFIALTGMQYAGNHLRDMVKSNPLGKLGVGLAAGSKMLRSNLGMGTGISLTEHVHADLANAANQTANAIGSFGMTTEQLLARYGKKITNEQFILNRVADSAIDIYGMVAVLSRASRSLQNNYSSAHQEASMCKVFCDEASVRIADNLKTATSQKSTQTFKQMSDISMEVLKHQKPVQGHPLGF